MLPALFLVLPAPCVTHSRYLNEKRLQEIMEGLGYERVKRKMSPKLVYYLYRLREIPNEDKGESAGREVEFGKIQVNAGRDRNNFCIVLKAP